MTDFESLLKALVDADVEFIIVGGVAAVAHGSARLTQDLDVVYSRSHDNIGRLASGLGRHSPYLRGAPPGLPFKWDRETIERGLNFTLTTDLGDIDLLGEITGGGTFEDLRSHTMTLELFGLQVLCLDLEWLMRVKRAAGRPRDLEVLAELQAILEESSGTENDS
jgi:predicted nucleotidyltransferase